MFWIVQIVKAYYMPGTDLVTPAFPQRRSISASPGKAFSGDGEIRDVASQIMVSQRVQLSLWVTGCSCRLWNVFWNVLNAFCLFGLYSKWPPAYPLTPDAWCDRLSAVEPPSLPGSPGHPEAGRGERLLGLAPEDCQVVSTVTTNTYGVPVGT